MDEKVVARCKDAYKMKSVIQHHVFNKTIDNVPFRARVRIVIFSNGSVMWSNIDGSVAYGFLTIPISNVPINMYGKLPIKWVNAILPDGDTYSY